MNREDQSLAGDEVARTLRPKEGENELETKCVNQRWTKSPNWRNLRANELLRGSCSHSSFYSTQFDITGSSAVCLWLYYGWSSTTESLPLFRLAEISTLDVGLGEMKRKRVPRGHANGANHMFWVCLKVQESDWKAVWHLLRCLLCCSVTPWGPAPWWLLPLWVKLLQVIDLIPTVWSHHCWQEVHSDTTSKIFIFNIIFKHHPEKNRPSTEDINPLI